MPTRRRPRLAVAALLLALVAVACSDRGESPAPTTGPPTTAVPAAPATSSAAVTATTAPSTTTTAPAAATTAPAVATTTTTASAAPLQGLALEPVASGLSQPTVATAPPGDDRVFVVERQGRVLVVDPDRGLLPEPFLDLTDRVVSAVGIEPGMLGLAFHPDYAANGRFFVYYTNRDIDRTLAEFSVSSDPNRADPDSERILLTRQQPGEDNRHYGGDLHFGPEGYLYVSVGDGARHANGQDPSTLFGTILRLDVDGGDPYAVPPDNPFVAGGGAPEVWVYGLRNPWRFSIDAATGLLYVGDVGQESWEEIDVLALDGDAGANLGWPAAEGSRCYLVADCELASFIAPVVEYSHDEGLSVTGGFVYQGSAIPEMQGHYFYADWAMQWIRSFRYDDGVVTDATDWSEELAGVGQPTAFGVDGAGELLVVAFGGEVHRIVPVR